MALDEDDDVDVDVDVDGGVDEYGTYIYCPGPLLLLASASLLGVLEYLISSSYFALLFAWCSETEILWLM